MHGIFSLNGRDWYWVIVEIVYVGRLSFFIEWLNRSVFLKYIQQFIETLCAYDCQKIIVHTFFYIWVIKAFILWKLCAFMQLLQSTTQHNLIRNKSTKYIAGQSCLYWLYTSVAHLKCFFYGFHFYRLVCVQRIFHCSLSRQCDLLVTRGGIFPSGSGLDV